MRLSASDERLLRMTYGAAYDHLARHPEFDGRPRPGHLGELRAEVSSGEAKPWPGVADVRRRTREEWIEARLDAVRSGAEEPALRLA